MASKHYVENMGLILRNCYEANVTSGNFYYTVVFMLVLCYKMFSL